MIHIGTSQFGTLACISLIFCIILTGCSNNSNLPLSSRSTVASLYYDQLCQKIAKTQIEMEKCWSSELSKLHTQLSTDLTKESAIFGKGEVEAVESQWTKYSKMECNLVAGINQGGSLEVLDELACETNLTANRIEEIQSDIQFSQIGCDAKVCKVSTG